MSPPRSYIIAMLAFTMVVYPIIDCIMAFFYGNVSSHKLNYGAACFTIAMYSPIEIDYCVACFTIVM